LWDWLSKNPDKRKKDWAEWQENGGNVEHAQSYCFACGYASENSDYDPDDDDGTKDCDLCPLVWPNGINCMGYGLYEKYWNATNIAKPPLAEQIRDLPVKDGVECK